MKNSFQIPVYVVDDEDVDRMIVRKRLERSPFGARFFPVLEADSGDAFLSRYSEGGEDALPPLVLVDVNMPRMDGFETIDAMERLVESGDMPKGIVVMMFTSSQSPRDRARAEARELVKGYIVKPFCEDGVQKIIQYYENNAGSAC